MSPSKTLLFAAAVSLLSACATPQSLAPGTTLDEARAKLRKPTGSYPLAGGGTRLQYSISRSTSLCGTPTLTRRGGWPRLNR